MVNLASVLQPRLGVACRQSGDELVVVLPEQGKYFVLNDTGAQVWRLADGQRTLADIVQSLVKDWGAEPDRAQIDVLNLAEQLVERGALTDSTMIRQVSN